MSTLKKCKVMLIPTEKKATVNSIVTRPSDNRMAIVNVLTKDDPQPCVHQHLYILSDEEIKEGDWIYDIQSLLQSPLIHRVGWINETHLSTNDSLHARGLNCVGSVRNLKAHYKKIIATTDILAIEVDDGYLAKESPTGKVRDYLPQPSQSFIEKYVEEYNKGNVITDVMVEYEIFGNGRAFVYPGDSSSWDNDEEDKLRINPKDNTITIKKVKDSYSREEVIELLNNIYVEYCDEYGARRNDITIKEWIQNNL